jgi:hypothetical protein
MLTPPPANQSVLLIFESLLKAPFLDKQPYSSTEKLKINEKMINFFLKMDLNELWDRETCGQI